MKKLHLLALSMLLSTSAIMMQAHNHDDYDAIHNLNKKRNDNLYDGSDGCGEGYYEFIDDGHDTYDEIHHLDKTRNSDTHPIDSSHSKNCRPIK